MEVVVHLTVSVLLHGLIWVSADQLKGQPEAVKDPAQMTFQVVETPKPKPKPKPTPKPAQKESR